MSNKLKRLDFAPGIKADDINYNFNLTRDWLNRERLRTAGRGLVEGFNMSADLSNFNIKVEQGLLINEAGEEIVVPEHTFYVGAPECVDITEETIPDEEGNIKLKFSPYSPSKFGLITYNPPINTVYPSSDEIYVSDVNTGSRVPILSVIGATIIVNAIDWRNRKLKVSYKYSRNRIDSIMLHKDGSYRYEKGIMSSSPSHVDLGDYPDYQMVGLVAWSIGDNITAQFYDTYRTYRKVYVDNQNRLYLNGKLYREASEIYFEEPLAPKINDIWYDHKTNTLLIWKEQDGDFGWVIINDITTVPLRKFKMWTPETFPTDAQTFLFNEDDIDLQYIPKSNALEIIIDNAILMQDQYEEIVVPNDKPYLSTGIGFKLKEPLDKPTFVQLVVHHSVRNAPLRETFQRAAVFISENYMPYNSLNTDQIFTTETPYVIGEQQLEVFVDGVRLQRDIDFKEMVDNTTLAAANDRGKMSSTFRVMITLESGEKITHKITRHVWSYDHLDQMVHEIEDKADDALFKCEQLQTDLTTMNVNVVNQFGAINNQIADVNSRVSKLDNFVQKTDVLQMNNLPATALAGMMVSAFQVVKPSSENIVLADTKITDFILVFYISQNMNRILLLGSEYTLQAVDNNVRIDLHPDLISVGANLCVCGIKFGL